MQNLQLGWQPAALLSAGLFAGATGGRLSTAPRVRLAAAYLREAGLVAALYALWQVACTVSVLGSGGAFERARQIVRIEHAARLPSERSAQRLVTGHPLLAQTANWYYAAVHFAALGVLLVWLFSRHRHRYPEVRNVLVLLTAGSLLIQLLPVAPPRLLPGYVDTAAQYGQSVYALSGVSVDQLGAMPSVHVGWALLIAWAVLRVSSSRYRWWVLAHPVLTMTVVVVTANHFWADGIVAGALLGFSIALVRLTGPALGRLVTGTDDRDAGRRRAGHGRQRLPRPVEGDHPGDQLVGSYSTGAD
ncbi:MAG: phosphatase PAP2 family protein [Actinobacteria bacterium]|nr:phosphatase PAP2 family protein [Actinomycetota bacterium]